MAYFLVHSLAVASYFTRSFLKMWAISGTRGSSGLGSVSRELMLKSTRVRGDLTLGDGERGAPLILEDIKAD